MPGAPGDAAADDSGPSGVFTGTDAGDATGPSGCVTCSSDLHQVLDCATNQVLRTCAANTGCGLAGTCIAPCDSAAANQSSIGCEYYVLNPDAESPVPDFPDTVSAAGSCFAAFVANTWTSPVSIGLEFDGQSLDAASSAYIPQGSGAALTYAPLTGGQLAPGQLAIVFLADYSATGGGIPCPSTVHAAYTAGDAAVHGTGRGHAFHLTTSAPVVAYDIYPYGGKVSEIASATLLLPTSAWDTNYVSVAAYQGEPDLMFDMNIAFVASQDVTTITINPAAAIVSGPGVAAAPQGAPATYTLNSGESIQFEQFGDLSGSLVLADKPIAAWGGHWGMDLPSNEHGSDAAHQQLPPVKALGHEYVAVRYRDRTGQGDESVPWRLAGAVDGTTLTYTPQTPTGAPTSLARGQVVEFNSPGPMVIASQDAAHPFYLAGHMTCGCLAGGSGDPETVNVVPPAQYLDHYVFFTDPTYSETNLVVVRDRTAGRDVTIGCQSGPLTGWQPIGTKYETTRIDLQHLGAKVGNCDNGRHEMTSSAPFGLTVWGWDVGVSYAYPAGASVKPINSVVVTPNPPK